MILYEFNNNWEDLILWLLPKNEFYTVLFWNKHLSYRWFSEEYDISKVLDFLKINKLEFNIINFNDKYLNKFNILVYGKEKKDINLFSLFYEKQSKIITYKDFSDFINKNWFQDIKIDFSWLDLYYFSYIWWILLWYPKCCINYHLSIIWTYKKHDNWVYDSIPHILGNTNTDINFLLNTLFHFWWRWYVHWLNNNDNIFTESLSFINHQPCSYDCQESQKIAYKNFQIFKKVDPEYFKNLLNKINKNYLYFDYNNWIAIDIDLTEDINNLVVSYWIITDEKLEEFFKITKKISKISNSILLYNDNLEVIKKIEITDYKWSWPFFIKFKK